MLLRMGDNLVQKLESFAYLMRKPPAYQSIGVAFPCAEVNIADDLDRGFAVLQTPSSATHVIVVPTTRISGIESPALLSENALLEGSMGRPPLRRGRGESPTVARQERNGN